VQMAADLSAPIQLFTPSDHDSLDTNDNDLGSGGLMVVPDQPGKFPHLALAAGKDGNLFVLNRDNMGGLHTPDIPQSVAIGGCWCGPSYFDTTSGPRIVSSGGSQAQLWSLTTVSSPPAPTLSLVASGQALEASGHDPGFFTSVSSQGTDANTAIIWAVGRAAGSDNHMTLYAFNATPSGGSLPLLWSDVAGFWPSTNANNNIVPTVANGRVYVASNQQLQIFGLVSPRRRGRFTGEFVNAQLKAAAPVPGPSGPQFWGTVKSIDGNRLVLELRSGSLLQVDVSAAIKAGRASLVPVGRSANVKGRMGADGVFMANVLIRAKGRSLWGEDREK